MSPPAKAINSAQNRIIQIMRYSGRFRIVACLIYYTLLFARSSSLLVGQNPQQPPSTSQSQLPDGGRSTSTSPDGGTAVRLAKVCTEKDPPPCATPPRLVSSPPPEYSSEARRAHFQGTCVTRRQIRPSTDCRRSMAGLNFRRLTASIAFSSSPMPRAFRTLILPVRPLVSTTTPRAFHP
jgi:hypothetical protein